MKKKSGSFLNKTKKPQKPTERRRKMKNGAQRTPPDVYVLTRRLRHTPRLDDAVSHSKTAVRSCVYETRRALDCTLAGNATSAFVHFTV